MTVNRRRFLSTTVLSGIGVAAIAGRASAFSEQSCDPSSGTQACRELIRHHELLSKLDEELEKKGLDEPHRKALLAMAVCPFCGQPLIG
ncbi:MAG TPA: hypothetical protein VGG27_09200 [Magnetospirillaceae bacterium]